MNHIAAALLLTLGGKKIEKKSIEDILSAAGSKPNPVIIESIIGATKGKSCDQIIKEGLSKLISSTGVSTSGPVEVKTEKVEDKKADQKKDDKKGADKGGDKKAPKKEVKVEDDDDMGMGLF